MLRFCPFIADISINNEQLLPYVKVLHILNVPIKFRLTYDTSSRGAHVTEGLDSAVPGVKLYLAACWAWWSFKTRSLRSNGFERASLARPPGRFIGARARNMLCAKFSLSAEPIPPGSAPDKTFCPAGRQISLIARRGYVILGVWKSCCYMHVAGLVH